MDENFLVRVTDPERVETFRKILGDDTVFVQSPIPELANHPVLGEQKVFKLDLDMYTQNERDGLVAHIAAKSHLDIKFVEIELASTGVAILADNCIPILKNPQRWI